MITLALDLSGHLCVVIGGGPVAEHKAQVLLGAGARVRVVSDAPTPGLCSMRDTGQIEVVPRRYHSGDIVGAMLVVAATGQPDVDAAVAEAACGHQLVSVSGQPRLGNVHFTAEFSRGPLRIAISTDGTSPALVKRIRQEVERVIGPEYAALAELLAGVRERLKGLPHLCQAERAALFEQIVYGPALQLLANGETEAVRALVAEIIGTRMAADRITELNP